MNFDKRHAVKKVPPISRKTYIWAAAGGNTQEGQVDRECDQPRSYNVAVAAPGNF